MSSEPNKAQLGVALELVARFRSLVLNRGTVTPTVTRLLYESVGGWNSKCVAGGGDPITRSRSSIARTVSGQTFVVIGRRRFFGSTCNPNYDAMAALRSLDGYGCVEVNYVKRFAAFTLPVGWSSVALRVVTWVEATLSIKTKADSERHGTSPVLTNAMVSIKRLSHQLGECVRVR